MQAFFQDGPTLGNQFTEDRVLHEFLGRTLPADVQERITPGLIQLGARAVHDIQALGDSAEANLPRLVPFDPWGRRIDHIQVSDAWKSLERIAAEEGLVAIGYERREGEFSRLHQFTRLYLFGPSSAVYTCPLAMTDGAARAIELYGDDELKTNAYQHLTSRDPAQFWTSGQWMTEKTGGSDVSGTSTIARWENGGYRLYGDKWFTSATTSQMAMALARIEGHPEGSRGLSLFYIQLRDDAQKLQNIQVHRLKDKLGTRAVPTAELSLMGTPARLVGGELHGVKKIASLFNITRIYNAVCAVGFMRRGIALARDYAKKRIVFGRLLQDQPLHQETLAEMQVEFEAAFHLTFSLVHLLGREELGVATDEESALLRLLTPVVKLYTGRQGVAVISEILESFGGAGYVEDTGMPRLLRDAQVLSIWEGTTNVLSLDTLRAIEREKAFEPWLEYLDRSLRELSEHSHSADRLASARSTVFEAKTRLVSWMHAWGGDAQALQAGARGMAYSVARIQIAILLLKHVDALMASKSMAEVAPALETLQRWCMRPLAPLLDPEQRWRKGSDLLANERV